MAHLNIQYICANVHTIYDTLKRFIYILYNYKYMYIIFTQLVVDKTSYI